MSTEQSRNDSSIKPAHPGGVLSRPWQSIMQRLAPETIERMKAFYAVTMKPGPLSEKLRHLIYVAIDSVPTHLYDTGIELHARICLEHDGTVDEIVEALEIASTVGDRTLRMAMPILIEECQRAGAPLPDLSRTLSAEEETFKAHYIASTGSWPRWLDNLLRVSPEFVMRYLRMAHLGGERQRLDPKSRELIFLAVSSCPAILDADGVRRHIKRCLELGATTAELIDAIQSSSGIGVHAFSIGFPEVDNALKNLGRG